MYKHHKDTEIKKGNSNVTLSSKQIIITCDDVASSPGEVGRKFWVCSTIEPGKACTMHIIHKANCKISSAYPEDRVGGEHTFELSNPDVEGLKF